jgi:hypothetical protein
MAMSYTSLTAAKGTSGSLASWDVYLNEVLPISLKILTLLDNDGQRLRASAMPVDCQKCEEIAFADAHHAVEPVRCKCTAGHPPTNCPVGDIQRRRNVADREKPRCCGDSPIPVLRRGELSAHLTNLLWR